MNELIKWVASQGLSNDVYSTMGAVGFVISFVYSIYHGKRYGVSLWKMPIIIYLVDSGLGLIQSVNGEVLEYIRRNHIFGIQTATMSIVRIFVFVPLVIFPLAKIFKIKWSKACDIIALYPLLMSGINQLPCMFTGCCAGYEIGWGLYNPRTHGYHFPTPILETVLTLSIFAYFVYRTHKSKFASDGKLYPLMIVMYGTMRFICEMLRDNEKIILGQSAMGIHAIIMVIVGYIWLYCIKRYPEWSAKIAAKKAARKAAKEAKIAAAKAAREAKLAAEKAAAEAENAEVENAEAENAENTEAESAEAENTISADESSEICDNLEWEHQSDNSEVDTKENPAATDTE